MIIYPKHYEQLCNRLWAFLPALSYALHYKKHILMIWAYKPYIDIFPNLRKFNLLISCFEHERFQYRRLIYRFWKFYDRFFLCRKSYRKISPLQPLVFSGAWECRKDEAYILEEKKEILKLFRPADDVVKSVAQVMKRENGLVYVGVHVRRGDYATFSNGCYFYEIDYYYHLMDMLYKQISSMNKRVRFLICSNENFDVSSEQLLSKVSFTDQDIIRFNPSSAIIDLYALSQCDYIFGPPSTFSQWASFYGENKLCFIKDKNLDNLSLESFKEVMLLDRFKE